MAVSVNDSINGAYDPSEFFSGDETLVQSLSNLCLGFGQTGHKCKNYGISDGYVRKDDFFNGVGRWRCEDECGGAVGVGVGKGGYLSCIKDCVDADFMSSSESSDLTLRSSSFFNSKKSCVDDIWECVSQEKSPYSWKSKDCSLDSDTKSFYSYGQRREVSDFGQGSNYSFPMSMCDFVDESVVSDDESINQCLKSKEVVCIASSKEGSQYLQNVLSMGDEEVMNTIFDGVCENVYEIVMDPYAQHLFQKLFDLCSVSQQEKLVLELVSDHTSFIFAAKNQIG